MLLEDPLLDVAVRWPLLNLFSSLNVCKSCLTLIILARFLRARTMQQTTTEITMAATMTTQATDMPAIAPADKQSGMRSSVESGQLASLSHRNERLIQ